MRELEEYERRYQRAVSTNYKTFKEAMMRVFQYIDKSSALFGCYQHLTHKLDFDTFYEAAKGTRGGMVGSGTLNWPENEDDALGMKLLLLRSMSKGIISPPDFGRYFMPSSGNFDESTDDFNYQIAEPVFDDFRVYLEGELERQENSPHSNDIIDYGWQNHAGSTFDGVDSSQWTGQPSFEQKASTLLSLGDAVFSELSEWLTNIEKQHHNNPPDIIIPEEILRELQAFHSELGCIIDLAKEGNSKLDEQGLNDWLNKATSHVNALTSYVLNDIKDVGFRSTKFVIPYLGVAHFIGLLSTTNAASLAVGLVGGAVLNKVMDDDNGNKK